MIEQRDCYALAGLGGFHAIVPAAEYGGDGKNAMVGERAALGFEVSGDHLAKFAESVFGRVGT